MKPYWEKNNPTIEKSYSDFNPIARVSSWTSPIMIIQGGSDYRVPLGQIPGGLSGGSVAGPKK